MNRPKKHRLRAGWAVALIAILGLAGCDFLDPTEVDNPATTDEDLAASEEPTLSLLPGLRAMFARAINPVDPEVISDNYQIRGTGIDKTFDSPRNITPDLMGRVARSYSWIQELRALSDFVLDDIVPDDETATAAQRGEAHYYRGMAYLLMGERFVAAPTDTNGTPVASAALIGLAITELTTARTLADEEFTDAATAALARAHYVAGDAASARTEALAVLAADADYAFGIGYDDATVTNGPFTFLYLRTIKEMQPNPRLDFLDPKYTARNAPIYVSKAEEMHLILAEYEFSQGNWGLGREQIALAIEMSATRGTEAFLDNDPRLNDDLSPRPRDAAITVRADASSPYRPGLVLSRSDTGSTVNTPIVSATSLDADSVRALTTNEESLHAMFLARQELMMLEGRRMTDLGIRLPISQDEIETNPNISEGDTGTEVYVPSIIPAQDELDTYSPASPYTWNDTAEVWELSTTEVTCLWDMNRILAQNWSSFGPVTAPQR